MHNILTRVIVLSASLLIVRAQIDVPSVSFFESTGRQINWIFDRISDYIPSRETLTNRVSDTFSTSSFDQAIQVLTPVRSDSPLPCRTTNDDVFQEGSCLRVADCMYYDGRSYGSCGAGLGSCCVFERTCGDTTAEAVTHFTNPRYPQSDVDEKECKLKIMPLHNNICQISFQFDDFLIAGPDNTSNCVVDFLGVSGGTNFPEICGNMSGQKLFMDVKNDRGASELIVDIGNDESLSRRWNVKVEQIACNSPRRATTGCLQLHNSTMGTVTSFNYINIMSEEGIGRQIQNNNYGVCVESRVGYCSLTWTPTAGDEHSFSLSGNSSADPSLFKPTYGIKNCRTDYVIIPGGWFEDGHGTIIYEDRYCGTQFPKSVTTSQQPYRIYVVTDESEDDGIDNSGFVLNYRHNLC